MLAPTAASDLAHKNGIISRLLDEADARAASIERGQREVAELRTMNQRLQAELENVKTQAIERQRYVDRIAQDSVASENIDQRELQRRHRMLGAAYRQDRRKMEMLQQQMTQMTASLGTQSQLQTAYANLREAHTRQARALQDQQEEVRLAREKAAAAATRVTKYRDTAHKQEKIIIELESRLKASMQSTKEAKAATQGVERERDTIDAKLTEVSAEVATLKQAAAELPADGFPSDEQVRLQLRAERAERRADAVENEMTELARESAKELAALKLRLSEKDAKLLSHSPSRQPLADANP